MSPSPSKPWEQLFPSPEGGAHVVRRPMRLLRRHGQPLLLLPSQAVLAGKALSLYPAQSWKARLGRTMLHWAQDVGLKIGTEACELCFDAESRFARFLCPPGVSPAELSFALLLGNPNVPGRRFVALIFNREGQPAQIVKAGAGPDAITLIRRERNFIRQQTAARLHAPAVIGEFESESVAAIALEYAGGPTPRLGSAGPVPALLEAWLHPSELAPFAAFAAAAQLEARCPTDADTRRVLERLNRVVCCPAIHHGDFVPWNIRVNPSNGQWRVLDWERGDRFGPPAWDWFHFLIQPLVLVRRAEPAEIIKRLELLRHSPAFVCYAQKAGIVDHFDLLLLGYLLHCRDVIQQAEGMPAIRALADLMQSRLSAPAGAPGSAPARS
jgi:hypothetical protein